MKLQTQIPLNAVQQQFGYENKLLFLGSCFAENIGNALQEQQFQAVVNPFGILFHPRVIERVIVDAVAQRAYTREDVFLYNDIWQSYVAHSRLNGLSQDDCVAHLNKAQQALFKALRTSSHVFITLGTAWGYRHSAQDIIVANCHKVPQRAFKKELWSARTVVQCLKSTVNHIRQVNPRCSITFTVSPVRHLKDGMVNNSRSKAHLLAAVHALCDVEAVQYFPAYEIMMDELRDYRFYQPDMIHPSEQAVTYIWERFIEVYAFAKAQTTLKEVQSIMAGLSHKPFNPKSEAHKKFEKTLKERIFRLRETYPFMCF